MALGAETNADLKLAFHDLRELKVDVAYPFLLELYHDYATGTLPGSDFVSAVRLVEAYVGGVLEEARSTVTIVERAYERGGATILDLLDAARTSRTIQQNYIEALFNYQHHLFQLESAVGQEIMS
jgi:hypothetical protein